MGLFDNLSCEYLVEGKNRIDKDFQTKSLNNSLDHYRIDKNGDLFVFRFDTETLPPIKNSKKKGFEKTLEKLHNYKRINERWEKYFFHGTIHFYYYSFNGNTNVDYIAIYNEGKLSNIYPATENGMRIYKDVLNGIEFLSIAELNNNYSDFIKKYSAQIFNCYIENEKINKTFKKILSFFHINRYIKIRGIFYSAYLLYQKERDEEFQEYMKKNPIVTHKQLKVSSINKKVKKKEKK